MNDLYKWLFSLGSLTFVATVACTIMFGLVSVLYRQQQFPELSHYVKDRSLEEQEYSQDSTYKQASKVPDLYINLRFLYDQDLLSKYYNDKSAVERFILSLTHSVSLSYNNDPINNLARFHFIVQSIELLNPIIRINLERNGDRYRRSVGSYYSHRLRSVPYTAMVLLTGYNFMFGETNKTDTQGLALVRVACNDRRDRVIIVEARSYRAAFILAHELGHTLNMVHDEEAGCGSNYIMSATTGAGKTKFSRCSIEQLQYYLYNFTRVNRHVRRCFEYNSYENPVARFIYGQPNGFERYTSISADDQCRCALGEMFRAQDMRFSYRNLCSKIGCINNLIKVYIHPAIENTTCDVGKYCRAGKCREFYY